MWQYSKKLEYPMKIKKANPAMAKLIISQLGGPDGETGAALRYLSQRYGMPSDKVKGVLTDIGTEELAHMEIISAIIYQLTRNLNVEDLQKGGFDAYYIDHTTGVYPVNASGVPFSASTFQSTGDAIADLHEDLAAEGTTAKERPVISTPEKALFYAGFRTFMLLKIAALDLIRTTNHKNMIGQAVSKKH